MSCSDDDHSQPNDLAARIAQLPPYKRAKLEQRLGVHSNALEAQPTDAIHPRTDQTLWPLSFIQESLFFLAQLVPGSAVYNRPLALRLTGVLDASLLGECLEYMLQRHDVLRSVYQLWDGQPRQMLLPLHVPDLPCVDLSALPAEAQKQALDQQLTQQASQPFDLAEGPLMRPRLFRLGDLEHVLLLTFHHILFDAWSAQVFTSELVKLYAARRKEQKEEPPALAPLPIQYADFSAWQRETLNDEVRRRQLHYWREQLQGEPQRLQLATDRPASVTSTFTSATLTFTLQPALIDGLKARCRGAGVTLYMALLAAFNTLLYRYSGQTDLWVGSMTALRNRPETEALIGNFLNTLVMRTQLSGDLSFESLLARTRSMVLGALANRDLPFEYLVRELHPQRDASHSPLFQVLFNYENIPIPATESSALQVEPIALDTGTAPFDLILEIVEGQGALACQFQYNANLFDADRIQRMAGHFEMILASAVADPEQPIGQLPMLTEAERHQLLVEFNDTRVDFPLDQTVHGLFVRQAEIRPEAVAVVFGGNSLTYRQVNERSNQFAHDLIRQRLAVGMAVGVCLTSSLDFIVALLGILKAGGTYVPLDPAYPAERLAFMLKDLETPILITRRALNVTFPGFTGIVVDLDTVWDQVAEQPTTAPETLVSSREPIYMIYTSGSTGEPKAAVIEHRSLVNHLLAAQQIYGMHPEDRVFQTNSISFDFSVNEIFLALTSGATLILQPDMWPGSIADFLHKTEASAATVLDLPTAVWHELVLAMETEAGGLTLPPSVRVVAAGGERMIPQRLAQWYRHIGERVDLINVYGPTETTIAVTLSSVRAEAPQAESRSEIPVGRPLPNIEFYVLDANQQPVPIGVPGELYIGGVALARGYWKRPELTAERFVRHLFSAEPGARLYRSGDLARFRADGTLEIVGRIDSQVKVRGFRVELGEIETRLRQWPGLQDAVAGVHVNAQGDKYIVAYLVPQAGSPVPTEAALRQFLGQVLPGYMLPAAFIVLDALPLSPNGKVNRQALPAPDFLHSSAHPPVVSTAQDDFVQSLISLWEEVLGVSPIRAQDNFFEIGGHSLLALRLITRIETRFGRKLPLATFIQTATVERLALLLRGTAQQPQNRMPPTLVTLHNGDSRPSLFCVYPVGGAIYDYRELALLLGPDQPVIGIQARGIDGDEPPLTSMEGMARSVIKDMQVVQPGGPYFLCGYSFGGALAFEVARQLSHQGQSVAFLGIIDTRIDKQTPCEEGTRAAERRLRRKVASFAFAMRALPWRHKALYLYERVVELRQKLGAPVPAKIPPPEGLTPAIKAVEEANHRARARYRYEPYAGRITYFRANLQWVSILLFRELSRVARGGWEVYDVPGHHLNLMEPPNVQVLAKVMRRSLAKAYAQVAPDKKAGIS